MQNQALLDYLRNVMKLEEDKYICEETIEQYEETIKISENTIDENKSCMSYRQEKAKAEESENLKKICSLNKKIDEIKNKEKEPYPPKPPKIWEKPTLLAILITGLISVFWCAGIEYLGRFFSIDTVLLIALICGSSIISLFIILLKSFIKAFNKSRLSEWNDKCIKIDTAFQNKDNALIPLEQDIKVIQEKNIDIFNQLTNDLEQREAENKKITELIASTNELLYKVKQQLSMINKSLDTVYDANIIHPDYRSFVPVSMFVNYIEKERCYKLEGINGCYNKYEEELRSNLIISKLDDVCESLDSIRVSMGTLHRAILRANDTIEGLCEGIISSNNKLEYEFESLGMSMENVAKGLEANIQNQNRLQALNAQIITDQTNALASIEQKQLDSIRRANMDILGHE